MTKSLSEWAQEMDKRSPKLRLARKTARKKKLSIKKVKPMSQAEFKRINGIPESYSLRWSGLRGVLWYYMSRKIRQEEFSEYGGKCVSCPRILERWEDGQCAHYISVSRSLGMSLIRKNLALSCPKCNNPKWSPDASIPFGVEIDRRYGQGTALAFYQQSLGFNDLPTETEIKKMIEEYAL